MVPMSVSFSLLMYYTEAHGLVEVDLSTILDLSDSNQFMSRPRATSFFYNMREARRRACLAPPLPRGWLCSHPTVVTSFTWKQEVISRETWARVQTG